jgi:hypothetical protein
MSTTRRRYNTVYDLSSLRLHPSDTRVLPDRLSAPAPSLAPIASSSAVTLQDLNIPPENTCDIPATAAKRRRKDGRRVVQTGPRAEWIAADVGGSVPGVARRPVIPTQTPNDEDSSNEGKADSGDEQTDHGHVTVEGTKKRASKKGHGKRKTKRRRLDADLDYDYVDSNPCTPPPPPLVSTASTTNPASQAKPASQRRPLPSSVSSPNVSYLHLFS